MIVAFIPGFGRGLNELGRWREFLPANIEIFDLPGHGAEPIMANPTIEAMAERLAAQIPSDALVVGESLGGLIALRLSTLGYRVLAVDPPLSTAKQWVLHAQIPLLIGEAPQVRWLPSFVEAVFGVFADGKREERNYWPLIDGLTQPVTVVAASDPLWPRRVITSSPSVIDDIDAHHLVRHPLVTFQRILGPHTLLSDNPDAIRPILLQMLAEGSGSPARAPEA